jgi:hypothetical protein
VVDIKDVYLGKDGENLVGGELQRRCKELLRKSYGHRELQQRAATKRQTKKK